MAAGRRGIDLCVAPLHRSVRAVARTRLGRMVRCDFRQYLSPYRSLRVDPWHHRNQDHLVCRESFHSGPSSACNLPWPAEQEEDLNVLSFAVITAVFREASISCGDEPSSYAW